MEEGKPDAAFLQLRSAGAVLSRGIAGVTRLIASTATKAENRNDPMERARRELAFGQTGLARTTLERALLADSRRLDLNLALLEIYRRAKDRQGAEGMWRRLQDRDNPARTEWLRLLTQLDEELRTT